MAQISTIKNVEFSFPCKLSSMTHIHGQDLNGATWREYIENGIAAELKKLGPPRKDAAGTIIDGGELTFTELNQSCFQSDAAGNVNVAQLHPGYTGADIGVAVKMAACDECRDNLSLKGINKYGEKKACVKDGILQQAVINFYKEKEMS
jgi:hypothetical protein